MIVPSPWLKKILKLQLLDCFKTACFECLFHPDGSFLILATTPMIIQYSIIQKLYSFTSAFQLYETVFIIRHGKFMTVKPCYHDSPFASLAIKM